jgi:predicted ATPase
MQRFYINIVKIDWSKISKDSYLRRIRAIKKLRTLSFRKPVTIFSGENGSGKSTLLEAIAKNYGFNEEGGTLNMRFETYNDTSELNEAIMLGKGGMRRFGYFFRAESFYNVASEYENLRAYKGGDRAPEYHSMSHGESFMEFITGFDTPGLFILDEPEAALSPNRQMELLLFMNRMVQLGAQFIIVTHSPILLSFPDAEIFNFTNDGLKKISYEETDSYKIMELFINHKDSILNSLLKDS